MIYLLAMRDYPGIYKGSFFDVYFFVVVSLLFFCFFFLAIFLFFTSVLLIVDCFFFISVLFFCGFLFSIVHVFFESISCGSLCCFPFHFNFNFLFLFLFLFPVLERISFLLFAVYSHLQFIPQRIILCT